MGSSSCCLCCCLSTCFRIFVVVFVDVCVIGEGVVVEPVVIVVFVDVAVILVVVEIGFCFD